MAAAIDALLAQPHKVIEQLARYIVHEKREPVVGLSNDEGTYSSHFSFGQTSLKTFKQTMGEAGATDEDSIARARRVPQVLAAYGANNVYNANETPLMYCHTYQQWMVKKHRQEINAKKDAAAPHGYHMCQRNWHTFNSTANDHQKRWEGMMANHPGPKA